MAINGFFSNTRGAENERGKHPVTASEVQAGLKREQERGLSDHAVDEAVAVARCAA